MSMGYIKDGKYIQAAGLAVNVVVDKVLDYEHIENNAKMISCADISDVKDLYTAAKDCILYIHYKEDSESGCILINGNRLNIGMGDQTTGSVALPLQKGDVVKVTGGDNSNRIIYQWSAIPYKEA